MHLPERKGQGEDVDANGAAGRDQHRTCGWIGSSGAGDAVQGLWGFSESSGEDTSRRKNVRGCFPVGYRGTWARHMQAHHHVGWVGKTLVADRHEASPIELGKTGQDTEDRHGCSGTRENFDNILSKEWTGNYSINYSIREMIESGESHCRSSLLACTGGLSARNHRSHPVASPLLGIVLAGGARPPPVVGLCWGIRF